MEGSDRARAIVTRWTRALAVERAAQVEQLVCATELVDAYARVEPSVVPGAERLVPSGAAGTPLVAEFVAAELAPLLGESIPTAWARLRDAVNLRHRHPILWQATLAGVVPTWQARRVAQACAELGVDAAWWVDERLQPVWGRLAWSRITRRLAGLIVTADHELARTKAEQRRAERFVTVRHDGDGSSTVFARLDTAGAVALHDAVEAIARGLVAEGRLEPLPELRAEALGVLATPTEAGVRPRSHSTLVVHVARDTLTDPTRGAARSDDLGPLLLAQVQQVLAHHRVTVVPVIDLAADPGVDAYEIPTQVARHVRVRDSFSCFPYSGSRARADLDHTEPFRARGPSRQTRASNLAPLARREHRAKTLGWIARQPAPGILEWESPLGFHDRVRGGRTTPLRADETLPWDPTGQAHYYPPPDDFDVHLELDLFDHPDVPPRRE